MSFDLKRNGDGRAQRCLRACGERPREQQHSARRMIWADGQRRRNWKSWRSTARHHFPGGNGTGGANFVVGVMLSVGAFARLTTRACAAPGTARELPPYEHDAVHGPNAQIAVITPRKVRRAADSAGRCIGGKKLRGSNPIWGGTYSTCVADVFTASEPREGVDQCQRGGVRIGRRQRRPSPFVV